MTDTTLEFTPEQIECIERLRDALIDFFEKIREVLRKFLETIREIFKPYSIECRRVLLYIRMRKYTPHWLASFVSRHWPRRWLPDLT